MAGSAAFLQALAEAHDWCEALGHASVQARHCRLVSDPAHPQVWSRTTPAPCAPPRPSGAANLPTASA